MLPKRIISGVIALLAWTTLVAADPAIRPVSRDDMAVLRIAAERARLAAFRPVDRPVHMIRYPVQIETRTPRVRPVARSNFMPRTRWEHKPGNRIWTRSAMSAASSLSKLEPRDIERWCPAYRQNDPEKRAAFWVGMMSALAKHESTYNPQAVGGGGLWYGLLQIYPDTARRYGCRATSGEALKNPVLNLSCAAHIMAVTVARDRAVAVHDGRWRGIAADWGPMTKPSKIAEMSGWTSRQDYCQPTVVVRPQARPAPNLWSVRISTMGVASSGSD